MRNFKHILMLLAVLATSSVLLSSCSKDASMVPSASTTSSTSVIEERKPAPGTYTISKFIDTGDDQTAQFNGYTFTFKKNGGLTATFNGQTFNGSWSLNSAQTVMTINIAGTNALNDLDDDNWNVVKISMTTIKISANGPDQVTFMMQ